MIYGNDHAELNHSPVVVLASGNDHAALNNRDVVVLACGNDHAQVNNPGYDFKVLELLSISILSFVLCLYLFVPVYNNYEYEGLK